MKLSDTEIEAAEAAVRTTMARTKLEHWPDGLLLHLLQLDQLTKLNEQVAGLKKAHLGAIDKMADLLELIEKHLPTAPYVPDEEEAAEAEWQAQMNRELEHASIVDPVGARQVLFADLLAKNLPGITPNVVLSTPLTAAIVPPAGFVFWGRLRINNDTSQVWVSEGFLETLSREDFPEQKIRSYLSDVAFERARKDTGKTSENATCPPDDTAPVIDPDHYA